MPQIRHARPRPLNPHDPAQRQQLDQQVGGFLRRCLQQLSPGASIAADRVEEEPYRIDYRDGHYSDCSGYLDGQPPWQIRCEVSHSWGEDMMHPTDQHHTRIWTLAGLAEGESLIVRHVLVGQLTQAPYICELVLELDGRDAALLQTLVAEFDALVDHGAPA